MNPATLISKSNLNEFVFEMKKFLFPFSCSRKHSELIDQLDVFKRVGRNRGINRYIFSLRHRGFRNLGGPGRNGGSSCLSRINCLFLRGYFFGSRLVPNTETYENQTYK